MKPNLYVIIVGPPGVGKAKVAEVVREYLLNHGKSVAIAPELNKVSVKEFSDTKDADCFVVSTTPAMVKKNNIWKMLGM